MIQLKKNVVECSIEELEEKKGIGPSLLGRLCGDDKQSINRIKNKVSGRVNQPHVVRYNEKTGEIQIVKCEKIVGVGNLNGEQ